MFFSLAGQIGALIAISICAFAFWKGGATERVFAGSYVLAWLASLVVQLQAPLAILPWALFAIDCILLVVYIGLCWRRSTWVVWATALQALAVASHAMNRFVVSPTTDAFMTVLNITQYGTLLALAIGTFWVWQENRIAVQDR
jgi:hypothetical protein